MEDNNNPNKNLFELIFRIFTIVALLVIIGQLIYLSNKEQKIVAAPPSQPQRPSLEQDADMAELTKGSYIRGSKDAKVSLVLFNSFTCGFCKKFKDSIDYVLKENQGKVNLVYHHFNRSNRDLQLSMGAECAGEQGKFWPMFDALFSGKYQGPEQAAQSLSLNMSKYNSCIKSGKYTSLIEKNTEKGVSLGITGTPGYVINGKTQVGYKPGPALDVTIKAAL